MRAFSLLELHPLAILFMICILINQIRVFPPQYDDYLR